MADGVKVSVTTTPTDVVAGQTLADGDYSVQNTGPGNVRLKELDAAPADPSTVVDGGIIRPGELLGVTVDGNAFMLWSRFPTSVEINEAD